MGGSDFVTAKKMNDKHVIVRLKCKKCPWDFFTMGGYNSHLFMDHKIRNYRLHPPVMVTNEDKCLTTSEPSVVSGDITPDDDVHMKTPTMLDELKSDKSLPDIPPPRQPVKVTGPVPEEDRDPKKFYCEYCVDSFFTKDSVKQHTDNAHFGHLHAIFADDDDYVAHKKNSPKPPEENTRGIKKRKLEKSVKDRHDSVSRRKRVRMSTKPIQSDSSSDVTDRRRTRSKSLLILQETEHREEEKKNIQERDTSLEMSKEEFVKSYNLRRKDLIPKMSEKSENDESNRKSKGDNEKRKTHGKSENTVGRKKGSKDMEQKLSSGNIASKSDSIKGDEIADKEENAGQNKFNDDENGQEGQLQDIDTAPDSAYQTENDTDTLQERSESTALDDTEKDPDFDVEKEEQKNSEVTITADETNQDEEGDNAEVTPMVPKKRRKKSPQKTFVNKKPGAKKGKGNDEDEEDDFYYHCDKCSQKFTDWKKLQKHKLDCVKVPQKFTCSKCNRGFQQKTIMEQHFDFYHTKKPKKYVCNEHNKCYVYKKSYDEHLHRDHSDGNYRFVCDYCGKGFFHKSEFSIHRDSVHLKRKYYACNKCQQRCIHIHRMSKCTFGYLWQGSKRTVWYMWENAQHKGDFIYTHKRCA